MRKESKRYESEAKAFLCMCCSNLHISKSFRIINHHSKSFVKAGIIEDILGQVMRLTNCV